MSPTTSQDRVLNIAYNSLLGGTRLEDIELRRKDEVYLNWLGTVSIPDPTTAGHVCRRFGVEESEILQEAINRRRPEVWRREPSSYFEEAIMEADRTMSPTTGKCREGTEVLDDGVWGYHPLSVSPANAAEPLYMVNRSGNRPAHEGAAARFEQAPALCREAGFLRVLFGGETD